MPEVCEVALTSQFLNQELKNQYLTDLTIIQGKYLTHELPGSDLFHNNKPFSVVQVDSKGKFMWIVLQNDQNKLFYILNNYGLTGEWSFESSKNDRIQFSINNQTMLYFADQRNFGLIEITDDIQRLNYKIDKLAPDVLKTPFTDQEFVDWVNIYLKKSKLRNNIPIVKALLKQDSKDAIVSGIGNYLSSEILYRSRLSPLRPIGQISQSELINLSQAIKYVVKLCYLHNPTGYMKGLRPKINHLKLFNYHPDISIDKDDQFNYLVYRQKKDPLGNEVSQSVIETSRKTYWVPNIQK